MIAKARTYMERLEDQLDQLENIERLRVPPKYGFLVLQPAPVAEPRRPYGWWLAFSLLAICCFAGSAAATRPLTVSVLFFFAIMATYTAGVISGLAGSEPARRTGMERRSDARQ